MQTDSTLKYLTRLCAPDLLPWLGAPDARIIEVLSPELPATDRRLDNLLRLQEPDGSTSTGLWKSARSSEVDRFGRPLWAPTRGARTAPYGISGNCTSLHLVEWQGYPDSDLFWRVLEYLGLLGRRFRERPIRVTIIYLRPTDDSGDRLDQGAATGGGWGVTFHTIRLWEQSAQAALASGRPGLLALLPLLAGATAEQVIQAAQTLLRDTPPPIQNDLLAALGTLGTGIISTERFLRLVTKERLMETDLISYLLKDKEAAFAAEKAALEERLAAEAAQREAAQRAALCIALQQAVEDAISARFPEAPLRLTRQIRAIADPARLQALIPAVITAPDLAAVEGLLAA